MHCLKFQSSPLPNPQGRACGLGDRTTTTTGACVWLNDDYTASI